MDTGGTEMNLATMLMQFTCQHIGLRERKTRSRAGDEGRTGGRVADQGDLAAGP